ncbi:apolipoprotein L4-like [Girardinichthys multiradiatus]|uniref:apolipoprotein L4-like n=1 Tax=Girardinichthys multiradiatus TaxID=208333 RepID=UPI001FAE3E4B|nr:apolipoprotein L4-like [Girardinichthys multiradiatus]
MAHMRWKLQRAFCQYVTDTLIYITVVKDFLEMFSEWEECRKTEVVKMNRIKKKADKIDPTFTKSEGNRAAFSKFMKSNFQMKAESKLAELENNLGEVLKETLEGLEKLNTFSDAVEKLAVTSLQVFTQNQMIFLPEGISFDDVQAVIRTARLICPLLLGFKRDAKAFFLPSLHNVEVLVYQLKKYINSTEKIVEDLAYSLNINICLQKIEEIAVKCDLSDEEIQNMADHVKQLDVIRMDEHFRMSVLFQKVHYSAFVNKYNDQLPQMLQFLDEIEQCAVQLDKMNKGAKISSVAGSSVGAVGGVLSIIGLALIPVTAGVSLGLIIAGASLGATSAVNSVVTTVTEFKVNSKQNKQANTAFQRFMDSVQSIQDCLEEATNIPYVTQIDNDTVNVVPKIATKLCAVRNSIDTVVDASSALVSVLKAKRVVASTGKAGLQEGKALCTISRVASDVPDIGQAALKGPLALSKGARGGLIALNALFIGMDIFFITKDSMALAKGTETKVSKFLRTRATLWHSEIEAWEKICNSLCHSNLTAKENSKILEKPLYPDRVLEWYEYLYFILFFIYIYIYIF